MKTNNISKKITISYLKAGYDNNVFSPMDICAEIVRRAKETEDMNIWITKPSLEAINPYLEKLKKLDKKKAPLWGIPFAIKDNIDLKGVPTTAGCEEYKYIPEESATVVRLLIEAGAIPLGKTNLDQFATGLVGTRSVYGETHNALKGELISGGSSSGSAVSVAMGQAAFSLGTDTAGSGRVPAALNDLVGLKSSIGAWSTKGVVPACASLDCVTVLTHNLEDAIKVDRVARVFDEDCPWSKPSKLISKTIAEKICIPKLELTFFGPYEMQYREKWNSVVEKLKLLNVEIEYIDYSLFSEAAAILYDGPWIAERWASLGKFIENNNGEGMVKVTETILKNGNSTNLKADAVFKAMHRLGEIKVKVKKILDNAVLIMPTVGGTYTRAEVNADPVNTNSNLGLYTNHCNLLGLTALDFQAGWIEEGIPFGLTSFALDNCEGLNFEIASLYQMNNRDEETTTLAVCGLHMRGFQLEQQLLSLNAIFIKEAKTAPKYKLLKLPTKPSKPGLIKVNTDGGSIEVELWSIPTINIGSFLANIHAPLGLGSIQLEDGQEVIGFICEGYMEKVSEDITQYSSWRNVAAN
ncbi:MAG: allophanate hydrolase [Ruminiclostridium sp.]